jgi:hypothetical protein
LTAAEERSSVATAPQARLEAGPSHDGDGIGMKQRCRVVESESGPISSLQIDVAFTLDRPPAAVWPHFSDFNQWHGSAGYRYPPSIGGMYSDPDGGIGTETFKLTTVGLEGERSVWPDEFRVVKVIPERAVILHNTVPEDDRNGGVSPGFHVYLLRDDGDEASVATVFMEHSTRLPGATPDEALQAWRDDAPEFQRYWTELFIPELRRLAREGGET